MLKCNQTCSLGFICVVWPVCVSLLSSHCLMWCCWCDDVRGRGSSVRRSQVWLVCLQSDQKSSIEHLYSTFLYPCMCAFCFVFKSDFLHMLPTVWPVIISTQAMPQLFQVILDKSSAFRSTEDAMSSPQITALQIYRCTIHLQHVILGRCFNNTVSKQPLVHG